jgi:NIMA (never in mitosis gene a)-related kinase
MLSGKDYSVKLGDFGTSQFLTKNYSFVHECVGTLFYLSPEVCRGDPFTTKTDIWSLGCIIYEMCTNRKPFNGMNDDNLKNKIITIPHPQLPDDKFSSDLIAVYNACMVKETSLRPSAKEILLMPQV